MQKLTQLGLLAIEIAWQLFSKPIVLSRRSKEKKSGIIEIYSLGEKQN